MIGPDHSQAVPSLPALRGRRHRTLVRAVGVAIVVAGVAWMVRKVDVAVLGRALAEARVWPIVVAAALNFGLIACKAVGWWILLGPRHRVPVPRLISYTITSCAASVILPMRAGELIRLWLLRDRDGVPIAHAAAVALAEKLLDIVSMLLLAAPLPWLIGDLPAALDWWLAGLAVGVIATLVTLRVVGPRLDPASWPGKLAAGLSAVHRPRVFVATVAVLFLGWLLDLAMVMLVLSALHVDLPLGAGVLVLLAINVTVALPSTPGQVGALELGAMVGLQLMGVSQEQSLAFAVAYHALQVVPVVLAGLALNMPVLLVRSPGGSPGGS